MLGFLKRIFGSAHDRLLRRYFQLVPKINELEAQYQALSDLEVRAKTEEFRRRIAEGETLDALLPEAYAVVKNVCRRFCGTEIHVSGYDQKWDMVPYDVQIVAAIAMHHGAIAEMQTGEGKTLTAVMPLYLNALSGKPVHLVTVNDYLADRDCQWVGSILRWLGLRTGVLTNQVPPGARKEIYAADVVYGTASEFGFDYLRDNSMAFSADMQAQRGFYYAIIDEVDSILIDEARTPLIISGPVPESRQMYDALKGGVSALVGLQRDLCASLATEARKTLDAISLDPAHKRTKKEEELFQEACHKLWVVGKGVPQNKVLKRCKENSLVREAIDQWDLYYHGEQNKDEKQNALAVLYMIVDERGNEYELTDQGIAAWDRYGSADDFLMLDISDEYLKIDEDASLSDEEKMAKKLAVREEDAKRKERAHNLRQLLRAHLLMEKDVDYIIQDGKIVIVDENTGRPQPGRRFSDGLHQAIEAKEGLVVQQETQTYATITLQNFFRMYEKLAGMTGTASTEALELKQIYQLDVVVIPTHRPCLREDADDQVYVTEREKYLAILKDVRAAHEKGRPVLVGTDSVDTSEKLSRIFRQNQLVHTVLNARHHEKEAEIIAEAGKKGAITIATNMAGRGTDIKLAPGVAEMGGLMVVVTTRNSSRRIDRQFSGRCARQGDPGTAKYFLSFEDSLLRLFASSPRLLGMLQKFRPEEGQPISPEGKGGFAAKMLNRSIETAQKRVEQRNYAMRKHTLEYDDVMNKQRREIYSFRNEILWTVAIDRTASDLISTVCFSGPYSDAEEGEKDWSIEEYRQWLLRLFPVTFEAEELEELGADREALGRFAAQRVVDAFEEKLERENQKIPAPLRNLRGETQPANFAIRHMMLRKLDQAWQEHLLRMDHLRHDVSLRAVGQRDPLTEFKHEAFRLFDALGHHLREEIARSLFLFEILPPQETIPLGSRHIHLERDRNLALDLEGDDHGSDMV